jgi:pimeloyl-ACP methyl ester carboxylesterase
VRGALSDILLRDVAVGMQQKAPNSRLVEIEGAGHSVHCDNPEVLEAAVRHFLRS